jgi:hypothetical protein
MTCNIASSTSSTTSKDGNNDPINQSLISRALAPPPPLYSGNPIATNGSGRTHSHQGPPATYRDRNDSRQLGGIITILDAAIVISERSSSPRSYCDDGHSDHDGRSGTTKRRRTQNCRGEE